MDKLEKKYIKSSVRFWKAQIKAAERRIAIEQKALARVQAQLKLIESKTAVKKVAKKVAPKNNVK